MNPFGQGTAFSIVRWCFGKSSRCKIFAYAILLFLALQDVAWSADRIVVSWEDNSLNELGFRLERAAGGGRFLPIATLAADAMEYVDSDVVRGTEYAYRVCAFNEVGESPFTNVVRGGFISRITNMSVRSAQVSATNPLTVGFVIGGSSSKSILVRGVGPTLSLFGLTQVISDPVISLYAGSTPFATNDNWGTATNADQVMAKMIQVGAFPLPESGLDAALLSVLSSGTNTAELRGKGDDSGNAFLEIYDADGAHNVRLVNFSLRVGLRDGVASETVGFVITGNTAKQVLIRAIGPALAEYGVSNVVSDPKVALCRQGDVTPLHENDDWGGTSDLKAVFVTTAAFALNDTSRDAALLVALEPGAYVVEVTGTGRAAGAAMIEMYEVR